MQLAVFYFNYFLIKCNHPERRYIDIWRERRSLFVYKRAAGQGEEKYFAISQSDLRHYLEIVFAETGSKEDGASWFGFMDSNQQPHGMKSKHFMKFHDLSFLNYIAFRKHQGEKIIII